MRSSHARANTNLDPDEEATPIDGNDEDVEESDDEEDEGEGTSGLTRGLTKYMRKLPESQRHVAIGKAFTLTGWPWSDPNWWVGSSDKGGESDEPDQGLVQFLGCMKMLSVLESEWRSISFRRSVAINSISCSRI